MDNIVGVPVNDQRPVPSVIDVVLPVERLSIVLIKFNRLGTVIAAGAVNGYLALIDFTTKRTASIWNAHVLGVSSISWSRDGSKLHSTALDNTYVISDVATGCVIKSILMGPGLIGIMLNPRNDVHVLYNTSSGIKLVDTITKQTFKLERFKDDDIISCLIFDKKGQHVIAGTSKGCILIYDLSGKIIKSGSIDTPQTIRSLYATKKLNLILVTASDRFIRVYDYNEFYSNKEIFDTENKLLDLSNKTVWQSACSSGEADYVAGMCATSHMITIFERITGAIVATLCESKKEIPLSFDWHPAQPAVASVCNGNIFVWKQKPRPCWAAYAPHFKELGENMMYHEKETEFDQYDEDMVDEESTNKNIHEEVIDVDNYKAPSPLCSSDEDDPNLQGKATVIANAETITFKDVASRPRFPVGMVMNPMNACDTQYVTRERIREVNQSIQSEEEDEKNGEKEKSEEEKEEKYNNINGHVNGSVNGYMSSSSSVAESNHSRVNGYERRRKRIKRVKKRSHTTKSSSSSDESDDDKEDIGERKNEGSSKNKRYDDSDESSTSSVTSLDLSEASEEPTRENWEITNVTSITPVTEEKEKSPVPSSISDTPLPSASNISEVEPTNPIAAPPQPPPIQATIITKGSSDISSDDSGPSRKKRKKSPSSSPSPTHRWSGDD